MPRVNSLSPSKLDKIHILRMEDARFGMTLDLLKLHIRAVDLILAKWGVTLLPMRRVGLEYPPGEPQALRRELIWEKHKLAAKVAQAEKRREKDRKARAARKKAKSEATSKAKSKRKK